MEFSDYISQVTSDAIEQIEWGEYDYCSDFDDVYDAMWADDSITGNGSGSYTFNRSKAWDNVTGNNWSNCLLFDDDFIGELDDMAIDMGDLLKQGPEAIDVTARCFALGYARDDIEQAWNERQEEMQEAC